MNDQFVLGIDFGTDSVRVVLADARNGAEMASSVCHYPRWRDGLFCDPVQNQFRQHPLDYVESLEKAVKACLSQAGRGAGKNVKAISVDTTGSTPVAVDETGTPLSLKAGFENNPHAMFVLWKDHTAVGEAAEINQHAKKFEPNYLKYVGGIYSSEWFWAKLLHVLREDDNVRKACYSWVEHCDWIPFLLTGGQSVRAMKRGVCSAGHKALWSEDFGGLPPDDFFAALDPRLKGFTSRLFRDTYTADKPAGNLSGHWAERLGLSTDVIVGVGAFDAHMGAVGGQIEPYHLSKVMGTSTCDILIAPRNDVKGRLIQGICGQVDGSVVPGMIGLEAGQSAFGDVYAWFRDMMTWPLDNLLTSGEPAGLAKMKQDAVDQILSSLTVQASRLPLKESDEISLDWLNGRRTPDANQELKGVISGINLASSAPSIFKSLVEATCFGAKAITERFKREGIPVKGLIGLGGVAGKSGYIMQVMADVMDMPIRIHKSEQSCAAGAAMFAATSAGIYPNVQEAMAAMGQGFSKEYRPQQDHAVIYRTRYEKYVSLGKFTEGK